MDIKWNPNFESEIGQQMRELQRVLDTVSEECSGQELAKVKATLRRRWLAVGNGAKITDPELTNVAQRISDGKRVWLEPNGKIMSDD